MRNLKAMPVDSNHELYAAAPSPDCFDKRYSYERACLYRRTGRKAHIRPQTGIVCHGIDRITTHGRQHSLEERLATHSLAPHPTRLRNRERELEH